MKIISGKAMVGVFCVMMISVYSLFAIFKIDDQDFWTQVWMIAGISVFSGLLGLAVGYAGIYLKQKIRQKRTES